MGLVFPRSAPNEIKAVAVLKSAFIMLKLRKREKNNQRKHIKNKKISLKAVISNMPLK